MMKIGQIAAALSAGLVLTAFPAAAQELTVQVKPYDKGQGAAFTALSGSEFRGNLNVSCKTGMVSFYKAGEPTAIKVQDGIASIVNVNSDGPAVEALPLDKVPDDLLLNKLCPNGRPDAKAARSTLLDRLAR